MARPTSTTEEPVRASSREGTGPRGRVRRGGFTLVECLLASTILAACVSAVVAPLTVSSQLGDDTRHSAVGTMLAEQLMEEIITLPYTGPAQSSTAARASFTAAGQYDGYHDTTQALCRRDGTSLALGLSGVYQRAVRVECRSVPAGPRDDTGGLGVVTVTVTEPGAKVVTLTRLMAK